MQNGQRQVLFDLDHFWIMFVGAFVHESRLESKCFNRYLTYNSVQLSLTLIFLYFQKCVCVFLAVILQEPQQTDLNNLFNGIFSAIGNSEQIKFNVNFVQINRNNVDETLNNCEH